MIHTVIRRACLLGLVATILLIHRRGFAQGSTPRPPGDGLVIGTANSLLTAGTYKLGVDYIRFYGDITQNDRTLVIRDLNHNLDILRIDDDGTIVHARFLNGRAIIHGPENVWEALYEDLQNASPTGPLTPSFDETSAGLQVLSLRVVMHDFLSYKMVYCYREP